MNILVIGIGQSLRGDDAAGLEAVRLWQKRFPDTAKKVQAELCELPGLNLLTFLDGMEAAVIVDALHNPTMGSGSLYRLGTEELASFTQDARSAHGWGVAETLTLGLMVNPTLHYCRIVLIGIAGSQFNPGNGLSPEVQTGMDNAVTMIEKEVENLLPR